jgi:hypothetical protein
MKVCRKKKRWQKKLVPCSSFNLSSFLFRSQGKWFHVPFFFYFAVICCFNKRVCFQQSSTPVRFYQQYSTLRVVSSSEQFLYKSMQRCISLGSVSLCGKVVHGYRLLVLCSRRKAWKMDLEPNKLYYRTITNNKNRV